MVSRVGIPYLAHVSIIHTWATQLITTLLIFAQVSRHGYLHNNLHPLLKTEYNYKYMIKLLQGLEDCQKYYKIFVAFVK